MEKINIACPSSADYDWEEKLPEWIVSIVITLWGLSVLFFPTVFDSEHMVPLLNTLPIDLWGKIAVFTGIARIICLIINGAWRPTAHLRAAGAFVGITFWTGMLSTSVIFLGSMASDAALFLGFLSLDFWSLWRASGDAKLVDQKAKKVKRGI